MGNPSSGCTTVQVPMSLSKRRHRQSLSLQLEQLGQLGSINSSEKKKSASAINSPKVKEEKSASSFLGSKPAARRKQSSLCGTEEYLKGIELHGGAVSDRKPSSFNPFRGHRRIGSGSTVTPCKSLESSFRKEKTLELSIEKGGSLSFRKEKSTDSLREKGGSLSFRKEKSTDSLREKGGSLSFRKEKSTDSPREKGGSLSFRKDRFAVAKIAASLFHSPTKVERSMSMSRVTQKAIQGEEVVSLRQQFLRSSYDGPQTAPLSGGKGSGLRSFTQDVEESAQPLISRSSVVQNGCVIDSSNLLEDSHKGDDEDLLPSPTIVESPTFARNSSKLLSDRDSQVFMNASESELTNLNLVALIRASNNDLQLGLTPEDILSLATGPSSRGSQSSRMETDSSEDIGGEKVYAVDDIPSLLFVTEKVTEADLTEAAVRSSLMSEEYLAGPLFFSSEDSQKNLLKTDWRIHETSLDARNETGLRASCDSDACLKKCMSFEPVSRGTPEAEPDRKSKARKRRRSVSASGIGAMLLKVVRVSDSGPLLTRRLPKVGPEVISGVDAIRAREYVLQKTAQISMGRSLESSSPVSASAACQRESNEVAKSTDFNSELDSKGDGAEMEKHPKDHLEDIDGTGSRVDCTFDSRQPNQQNASEMVPRHPPVPENANSGIVFSHEMTPTSIEVENCFPERLARVNSNLQRTTPDGTSECQIKTILVNGSAYASAGENADERRGGKARKKSNSRGRNSYDSDSLTEGPKTARSNSTLGRNAIKHASLSTLDANVAITRERSRSFKSRLQAPSGLPSVDVFHLAPSSISILANPSFSSSHQDRLWEEQAEAYSSGGRGTPGRDDELAAPVANVFLQSPSPGVAISSDDHQVPSASASLRRGGGSTAMVEDDPSVAAGTVDKGRHKRKGKRGRPHTPLRSLLADDAHSKGSPRSASRPSPEGGHFIQQIMSRMRGSKSLSPKNPHHGSKKRSIWSSCICFSIKCQA